MLSHDIYSLIWVNKYCLRADKITCIRIDFIVIKKIYACDLLVNRNLSKNMQNNNNKIQNFTNMLFDSFSNYFLPLPLPLPLPLVPEEVLNPPLELL